MGKIIRYWNRNRKQIIIIIAIIAFIIILLKVVNNILSQTTTPTEEPNISNVVDLQKPTESVITGQDVSESVTEENVGVIKKFIDYCNNSETTKAYELLSNDCKKEFNNDINVFIKNYYTRNFKTKKTYNLELMFSEVGSYTYKTTYYNDDLLATGGKSTNDNFEDYITIINQDGERKLNINGFIKKQEINKEQTINEIQIIIKNKKVYRSYEQYRISIKNNTENTISISDGQNSEDIFLLDKNDTKYVSFLHEIPIYDLSIDSKRTKELDITFNKMYDTYRIIEKMQFNNICLNQEDNTKTTMIIGIQ